MEAKYGGRHTVTCMPGDGIGPEMMGHMEDVLRHAMVPIDFETMTLDPGTDNYDDLHNAIQSVRRNGVAIKGNIETRMNRPDIASRNVELRNKLDLFANVVHCKSQPGLANLTRHQDIDIHIIRQNTEGEYAMLEHENVPGVVESLKIVTEKNTERLCRFAFNYAVKHSRKKVTLVHKANILKVTDGLFIEVAARVAAEFPDIEHDTIIIDNCCMQMVSNPWQFDVVLLTNLYGTIVTNLVCGLLGGPGIVSGSNFGPNYAIFEPATRNTGTSLEINWANPSAMLNAAAGLLSHIGLDQHGGVVRRAVFDTINVDRILTADLGGTASTEDVVRNVKKRIDCSN